MKLGATVLTTLLLASGAGALLAPSVNAAAAAPGSPSPGAPRRTAAAPAAVTLPEASNARVGGKATAAKPSADASNATLKTNPTDAAAERRPAEEIPLPGVSIPYEGGWMSLAVESGVFHLRFYDAKRELLPVPAIRATARWNPPLKTGFSRSVLLPANEGRALVGNTFVRPPLRFRVYLTLIGADDQVMGSYSLDFES
jgi:hypothetical protein